MGIIIFLVINSSLFFIYILNILSASFFYSTYLQAKLNMGLSDLIFFLLLF